MVPMKLTGHKTISVYQRYSITDDERVEEATAKLAAYLNALRVKRATPQTVVPLERAAQG